MINLKNRTTFYLLSFTWGLPLTLVGFIVAGVLLCVGYKPQRWGDCWHFSVGKNWGGLELGLIFLTGNVSTTYIKNHEHGHAIQNCFFGPLMPFVVCIPSAIRYWYRIIREKIGKPCKTNYYDIWFEAQASRLGSDYVFGLKK